MNNLYSYWERESFLSGFDILIVGSGIVGLSTALSLKIKHPGLKTGIIESGFLPTGASTKNAGFACFGSISELIHDLKTREEDEVLCLIEMRWKGLERLRKNLGDTAICLEQHGGYELFKTSDIDLANTCIEKIPYFNNLLKPIIGKPDIYAVSNAKIAEFGFKGINKLILNNYESQIDTGKMMQSLIRKVQSLGVSIFNNCKALNIERGSSDLTIISNQGNFKTKTIILASNAYIKELIPDLDVIPGRGQVLITEPIKNLKLKGTFHYNGGYTYFRNINNRILLGGGRNLDFKAEETTGAGLTDIIQNELENLLYNTIVPGQKPTIDMRWSGVMGFGSELKPIVKKISTGLYCAVRCNGMGIAIGSLMGDQVAELIEV